MSDIFDLGGGGGTSFPFETVGDTITGRIKAIEEVQQTDMDSGLPATWENGQPKMMVRVDLTTDHRDITNPGDDGTRSVYLKGSRKAESKSSMSAALVAVRAVSGATSIAVGGTFTLTYVGDGVPSKRGFNAPKQYEAAYAPPSVDLAPQAPVVAAPAPAPVAEQIATQQAAQAAQQAAQQAAFIAWQQAQAASQA